ncbi:hypothetical protein EVA_14147 [gut metagenome]|uniref:Uncharacterized protein n=1 Tax=gut metagenome TaxID=749906 RepID=J9FS14_9ZZZZ
MNCKIFLEQRGESNPCVRCESPGGIPSLTAMHLQCFPARDAPPHTFRLLPHGRNLPAALFLFQCRCASLFQQKSARTGNRSLVLLVQLRVVSRKLLFVELAPILSRPPCGQHLPRVVCCDQCLCVTQRHFDGTLQLRLARVDSPAVFLQRLQFGTHLHHRHIGFYCLACYMARITEQHIVYRLQQRFLSALNVIYPKAFHLVHHPAVELCVEHDISVSELPAHCQPGQCTLFQLSHAKLVLQLAEPVLRHVVRVHLHLSGLTFQDALIAVRARAVRNPKRTVRAHSQVRTLTVHHQPVTSRPLDDFLTRSVRIESAYRVLQIMTGTHREILLLRRVNAALSPPQLVGGLKRIKPQDGSYLRRTDTALAVFHPFSMVSGSDYCKAHDCCCCCCYSCSDFF